jgi:hypothetical protein
MEVEKPVDKYLLSMRKANKKYRERNREKLAEYQKKYYQSKKTDENYAQKQREKALNYYYRKKEQLKEQLKETIQDV